MLYITTSRGLPSRRIPNADHAVFFAPSALIACCEREIEIVGAQSYDLAPQRVEGMTEQQQLARRMTCVRQRLWAYRCA
jgi:hypothetical protein